VVPALGRVSLAKFTRTVLPLGPLLSCLNSIAASTKGTAAAAAAASGQRAAHFVVVRPTSTAVSGRATKTLDGIVTANATGGTIGTHVVRVAASSASLLVMSGEPRETGYRVTDWTWVARRVRSSVRDSSPRLDAREPTVANDDLTCDV
jgi:hypothetical protein